MVYLRFIFEYIAVGHITTHYKVVDLIPNFGFPIDINTNTKYSILA